MPSDTPLLQLSAGAVGYGKRTVFELTELVAEAGAVSLIVGTNGSGKTSLFRAILGLEAWYTGFVRFAGRDLAGIPTHERILSGIRYLPQERRVFERLSPSQHLRLARRFLGETSRNGAADDGRLSATILERRSSAGLSGGETRKLILESISVGTCRLLLLDEPFAGLDERSCEQVGKLVAGLIGRGAGCIVTDHTSYVLQHFEKVAKYHIEPHGEQNVLEHVG